jgi:O-antigen/teichoic acid export membrane protein
LSQKGSGRRGKAGRKGSDKGTGAALGTEVLRYSGLHSVAVVISNAITFATTIVIANFIDPGAFGQLGLLLFFSALLTLLFTLAAKQGTMKRTFGGDDDDDDDDEEDDLAADPRRVLGTGLIVVTLVSIAGTLLAVVFAEPIGEALLEGNTDVSLIVWAAVAGGTGAVYRVASIAVWLERRPMPYIALEASRPLVTIAVVVPLLIADAGLEGAIAGMAIGSAISTIFALILLRNSFAPVFDLSEVVAIYKKGSVRVPLVLSMWIVGYADILILSRYVSAADLGTYHLASRAGFFVAFLPGGYRKALRPLQKTTTFAAVEEQYGVGTARGIQFGYFSLMLTGIMLAVTVFAHVVVRVAPESYAQAGSLIPILSAGLVAPTVYRMLNKSVKYGDKRRPFIVGAVVAAVLFVVLAIVLVQEIGLEGAPLAMIIAFLPPSLYIFYRSQTGRSPIRLPWRSMVSSIAIAVAIGFAHAYVDVGDGIVLETLLGLVAVALWCGLILVTGGIPDYHRGAIIEMVRSVVGRGGRLFDPAQGLASIPRPQRRALRRAVLGGKPAEVAVDGLLEVPEGEEARTLVAALRKVAVAGGTPGIPDDYATGADPVRDQAIGEFLFAEGTIAGRDQMGKRLLNDGEAEPFDLHTLEATINTLRHTDRQTWKKPKQAAGR